MVTSAHMGALGSIKLETKTAVDCLLCDPPAAIQAPIASLDPCGVDAGDPAAAATG